MLFFTNTTKSYFRTSFFVGQGLAIACFAKVCFFTYPSIFYIHLMEPDRPDLETGNVINPVLSTFR